MDDTTLLEECLIKVEEEEMKPLFAVFLQPDEEMKEERTEEQKDPLAPIDAASPEVAMKKETNYQIACDADHQGDAELSSEEKVESQRSSVQEHLQGLVHKKSCSKLRILDVQNWEHADEKHFHQSASKKTFLQKDHLVDQKRIQAAETPFKCSICKKLFSLKHNLVKHMLIHTREPFKCSVCKKSFSQRGALTVHMQIHTEEKPFECLVCKKTFSQRGSLNVHKRIHTEEKPFECSVCKKSFGNISNFHVHKRIHAGEKSFHCSICERHFLLKHHLDEHMRIHTGERPYKCLVCNKSFAQRCNLSRHKRLHKEEKPL